MPDLADWGFYGRAEELSALRLVLKRDRWFFARITGRRRIGKTTLVQRALAANSTRPILYVQIPDSGPAGVLSSFHDAMDLFEIDAAHPRPTSLSGLARTIGRLAEAGHLLALDEFQYFSRKPLYEFTSHLQAVVDDLSRRAAEIKGGLLVLGSLHVELVALLDDRKAPLYNRTTDHLELDHLDIGSVLALLEEHADTEPERLLFLWNLFEGVPKFYRDCYEQEALRAERAPLLRQMFFRSSSPLRSEAEHWFLSELRGRYDVVLKYVARHPGCSNADVQSHVKSVSADSEQQVAGYLKTLTDKYRMIERRLPIFAPKKARKGRFYIRDNFLRTWLDALQGPVSAINFRPEDVLVAQADARLMDAEGHGLERLVATLYEERSKKGVGDFGLTRRIDGYWDRAGTEIDLVAVDDEARILRFGTCKRSASKLLANLSGFDAHVDRFLEDKAHKEYRDFRVQKVAIAPVIGDALRAAIEHAGYLAQDLHDLTEGLR